MSNDIVDPNSLASGFWDSVEADDFAVPRVTIGQPTSTKGIPGKFNFNNGVSLDAMPNCKLIVPTKTRVLYAAKGKSRCASDNFYEPSKRIMNPVSENCLTCPLSQWESNRTKLDMIQELGGDSQIDPKKPLCTETFNLLMADDKWTLFFIAFQKTQLKVVKDKLFSRLRYGFNGAPPFHVAFDMHLAKATGVKKAYYGVEFSNFRIADEKEKGAPLVAMWKARAASVLADQHNEMDEAHERVVNPMPTTEDAPPEIDEDEPIPF